MGSVGQPPPARSAGLAGSINSNDGRVESGDRARGCPVSGSAATADASRRGRVDRISLRADHGQCGALSVWEAGGELSGISAPGKIQWASAATGAHHPTREFDGGFLWVEAAQVTVRSLPEWRSQYFRRMMRRGRKPAKVALARRRAIGWYWMWREGRDYEQQRSSVRTQDSSDQAMVCSTTPSN